MTCATAERCPRGWTADAGSSVRPVDDDADLVERSRAGDLRAFEALVERHSEPADA